MNIVSAAAKSLDATRPLSRKDFLLNSLYVFLLTLAFGLVISLTGLVNSLLLGRITADVGYLLLVQIQCRRFTDIGLPRWMPWVAVFFWWLWKFKKLSVPTALAFASNAHGLVSISVIIACLALPSTWMRKRNS